MIRYDLCLFGKQPEGACSSFDALQRVAVTYIMTLDVTLDSDVIQIPVLSLFPGETFEEDQFLVDRSSSDEDPACHLQQSLVFIAYHRSQPLTCSLFLPRQYGQIQAFSVLFLRQG